MRCIKIIWIVWIIPLLSTNIIYSIRFMQSNQFRASDSLNSDVRTSSDNLRSELSEGRKYETINRNSNKENKFLYKDSSAIRESAKARDEFKPIQFPTPQRYDESNVMGNLGNQIRENPLNPSSYKSALTGESRFSSNLDKQLSSLLEQSGEFNDLYQGSAEDDSSNVDRTTEVFTRPPKRVYSSTMLTTFSKGFSERDIEVYTRPSVIEKTSETYISKTEPRVRHLEVYNKPNLSPGTYTPTSSSPGSSSSSPSRDLEPYSISSVQLGTNNISGLETHYNSLLESADTGYISQLSSSIDRPSSPSSLERPAYRSRLEPYSGESVEVDEFEFSGVELEYSTEDTLAHPGSINFSAEPISARLPYLQPDKDKIKRDPTEDLEHNDEKSDNEKKWKPKNKINSRDFRKRPSYSKPNRPLNQEDSVTFGILISPEEGTGELECLGPRRSSLISSIQSILELEMKAKETLEQESGIQMNVDVLDECLGAEEKRINQSFLLLRNSLNSTSDLIKMKAGREILNVSRKNQIQELAKALRKVGIHRFHVIRSSDIYSPDTLSDILSLRNVDTIIADVHGKELELLIEQLSGLAEPAAQFTWIFTSILSSEVLIQIEQLISRTKVMSIFPLSSRRLLRTTVKQKNNTGRLLAVETSLPYIEILKLLQLSYNQAWKDVCRGEKGICQWLKDLSSTTYLENYFNPTLKQRRESTSSYMLIVYTSSSTDEIVDLQIPGSTTVPSRQKTTVRAVFSTVGNGTVAPKVIISETVSTINIIDEEATTTVESTTMNDDDEDYITEMATSSSSTITTTTSLTTSNISLLDSSLLNSSVLPAPLELYNILDTTTEDSRYSACSEFTACVIYISQNHIGLEGSEDRIHQMIETETYSTRRPGLNIGSVHISRDMLDRYEFAENVVATVSVDENTSIIHPDIQHFNIIQQDLTDTHQDIHTVANIISDLGVGLGWSTAVLVFFNSGVGEDVALSVLNKADLCITSVINLNLNYIETQEFKKLLDLYKSSSKFVIISESPDQISHLIDAMVAKSDEIEFWLDSIAWSYLQSSNSLSNMAEHLPDIDMMLISADECEYCESLEETQLVKGLRSISSSISEDLESFSKQICEPALFNPTVCIQEFRAEMDSSFNEIESYNILQLNPSRFVNMDESLFMLAGDYKRDYLNLYNNYPSIQLEEEDRLCINSTVEYDDDFLKSVLESNLQSLWGSIALGISAFGMLILVITGLYTGLTIARKDRADFTGDSELQSLPLHYLLLLGLLLLFSSSLPLLFPVGNLSCLLRTLLPGVAFAVILSSMLVNLVSTWRRTIYTVNPAASQICFCISNPSSESSAGLLLSAFCLIFVQIIITGVILGLNPPVPLLVDTTWRCQAFQAEEAVIFMHSWLFVLTLTTVVVALACLKYCSSNGEARWSLLSLLGLITIWTTWGVLINILDYKYREPVSVLGLVVSALVVLVCVYARKLYELSEFGKLDTKLELMSNILLSESPTHSQSTTRSYGTNVLPGIIAMPEFEDNSILGEDIYHAVQFEGRQNTSGPVNMKMFEVEAYTDDSEDKDFERNSGFDTDTVRSPTISRLYKEEDEGGEVDSIYHTISRGVSYTPVLKKIGSRKMLVLPDQHTLTHGSTSRI